MAVILFADDEHQYLHQYQVVLQGLGHTVLKALNVEEALETLKTHPVDVLIIDMAMPFNGTEHLLSRNEEELRQLLKDQQIAGAKLYCDVKRKYPKLDKIILSARGVKEEIERNLSDYVSTHAPDVPVDVRVFAKGVAVDDFVDVVQELLSKS